MASDPSTVETPIPAASAAPGKADLFREALRREQRGVSLWWMPAGLSKWAVNLGASSSLVVGFLESAFFPLGLMMAVLFCSAAACSVVGLSLPFLFWLCYLAAVTFLSRYSVAESIISSAVIVVFALVLHGLGLSEFQPTLYFVFTIPFLGTVLGISHAGLLRRVAEQSVNIQKSQGQSGSSPRATRSDSVDLASSGTFATPRAGRLSSSAPGHSKVQDGALMVHLGAMASATQLDQVLVAFQASLLGAMGVSGAQLWRVEDMGGTLILEKNLGQSSVAEGTSIETSSDEFLTWLLKERRIVVFDPAEKVTLEGQFGESLPQPLLPMASIGSCDRVLALLRVTGSSRKNYTAEDRKTLGVIVHLAEEAFYRTAFFPRD